MNSAVSPRPADAPTDLHFAVVVPIHNGLEQTQRFLESFDRALDRSPLRGCAQMTIVDDGSTDGSAAWIRSHYPRATVLSADGSLWWTASVNLALEHLEGGLHTHVLLFNNDNILDGDFFIRMSEALARLGRDRIISSKVLNQFPEPYVGYGGVTYDRRRSRYIKNPAPDVPTVVNTAGGMGVLIPAKVIAAVGRFDAANFPQKSADTDFYLRAERLGHRVHYEPGPIIHNDNRITGVASNRSLRGIIASYSYPKGYMNLRVDWRLFSRHGSRGWAVYEIARHNALFLAIGAWRVARAGVLRLLGRDGAGNAASGAFPSA